MRELFTAARATRFPLKLQPLAQSPCRIFLSWRTGARGLAANTDYLLSSVGTAGLTEITYGGMTVGTAGAGDPQPRLHRIFQSEAAGIRSTPFGEGGTLFSGSGMENAWGSKQWEELDPDLVTPDPAEVTEAVK